jgi:hypothetical protein
MQKIDVTIAKLRLLLADVTAKEHLLGAARQQFRDQLRRAVEYSIYGDAALDATLGLMGEIQQRVTQAEAALRDLGLVRARAERELESLMLTKRIEADKSELADLLARQAELGSGPSRAAPAARPGVEAPGPAGRTSDAEALDGQIRRLRQQINEASERAARTLDRR